ncbi:MAG: hypothetical protein U0271_03320 [Polyangiaceae bacterium]
MAFFSPRKWLIGLIGAGITLLVGALGLGCDDHRAHSGADACGSCEPGEYCAVRGVTEGDGCRFAAECLPIPADCVVPDDPAAVRCTCLEQAEGANYPEDQAASVLFGCESNVDVQPNSAGGAHVVTIEPFLTIRSTIYDPAAPAGGEQCL